MIRTLCLILLSVLYSLPVFAGYGTIRETDTEIIVEYYGDESEALAGKIMKEEEQQAEQKKVAAAEKIHAHKRDVSETKAARRAENRKEEEE